MIRFSLVIPAYNEALLLPRLLDSVAVARGRYRRGSEAIEVVVADNGSTDDTASIAKTRGCEVVRVEKRVIAVSRNGGARAARGEIVCFIDADCTIHPETFNAIDEAMARPEVVGGATGVMPERWSPGLVATWLLFLPGVLATGMDAGAVFCRRSDFEALGGYNESLDYAEDVAFLWALRKLGRRRGQRLARLAGVQAVTSTRKFDRHGDWHYFTLLPRSALALLRSRHDEAARRYWYDDR